MSEWISVKDDLPDEFPYDVLVMGKNECDEYFYDIAFYDDGEWKSLYWEGENITHWMPLPELPKE